MLLTLTPNPNPKPKRHATPKPHLTRNPNPNPNPNPNQVCQHEGLAAEANTLAQLATIAQNDVRACLNTLQLT